MKKILGLDLGTNSIGWAVVNEAENKDEKSSIIKLGVRVNPLSVDELSNFEKGKSITTNADRTLKRSARRNLQRYKLRRENLINLLKNAGFISDKTLLSENGNKSTFETYRLRAKAATEEISLEEFARVLLMINKKRGYKSSRKAKSTEEGQIIDGMSIAIDLYEKDLTPGQYSLQLLNSGKKYLPDFYSSDLLNELQLVWNKQKTFYPEILSDELFESLKGKNKTQTWAVCSKPFGIVGIKRNVKGFEQKLENYKWRQSALHEKIGLEELAIVLQEINGQVNSSSGYLGAISDRSKELYFNKQTVGQYLMSRLDENPNYSLKNQVFYRQDYLDEFEKIWECQAEFHKELTGNLKKDIRDIVIFYQRPLKSQKGLISFCEFEQKQAEFEIEGQKKIKTIGLRVCPKSSPLFQEFKVWQILNNIQISGNVVRKTTTDLFGEEIVYEKGRRSLTDDEKNVLWNELNYKDKLSKSEALKLLFNDVKGLDMNYCEIEGNKTQSALFKAYQTIIEMSGHDNVDLSKKNANDVLKSIKSIFEALGIDTEILFFDSSLEGDKLEHQKSYQLWHLLYSYEGDSTITGTEKLLEKLNSKFGFSKEYAAILANVVFPSDYGSLSSKAIKKILPHLRDGLDYSTACEYAGYRHSKKSLTKEEIANKILKDKLELLPRNSMRNPVVEKILNQMINVVNEVVKAYGKPDEIRIELARELKKSAKEREDLTSQISKTTKLHEQYKEKLQKEFGLQYVSRNDIIRYKLYCELEQNGFKTLYTNTYIPKEKLFSKEFDIEHIIPQAKLFDDSFSNKTLESRSANLAKSNTTALDYVSTFGEEKLAQYKNRIDDLYKKNAISKTKRDKLLMAEADIPSGFINRDLRDSQYIAKKAREILEDLVRYVVPTTGSITDRLREDWQLVEVMQELNWDKYNKLGLTEYIEDKDGRQIPRIKDWTKRNDHRHHAMDALTIAFTKRSFIQYLNNLNARIQKTSDEYFDLDMVELSSLPKEQRTAVIYAIEQKELHRDKHNKLRFNSPMPVDEFRCEAKKQLQDVLVSIKAKNKVVTRNINVTKSKDGKKSKIQLTPRRQLHLETIYGASRRYRTKDEKIGVAFNEEKIQTVACKKYRDALMKRLREFGNDSKLAFTGKNALLKNPLYIDEQKTQYVPEKVKTVCFENIYTIRKPVSPDLNVEKVIDPHIRKILQERLEAYKGNAKEAFSNLEQNPIYLNEEKGIAIKRVTISGVNNAIALHDKRDNNGNLLLDSEGKKQPVDFVNTGNNHHVAIYKDNDGNIQDVVVSFMEVVERVNQGLPIIDKYYKQDEGWKFLFTMKQNEYFVFPNEQTGFNPFDIDLMDEKNYSIISSNLYRVQKMSKVLAGNSYVRDYVFRHHLETTVKEEKVLRDVTYKQYKNISFAIGIIKVRLNHIGKIVSIGEY